MVEKRTGFTAATIITILLVHASPLRAQSVEVSPFYGYLFGNDLFEAFTGPLDTDGSPALGVTVDVPLYRDFQIEALFSHQAVNAVTSLGTFGQPVPLRITVDHWQAGGLQEFDYGRARPFLTGTLGLTHFAIEGDHEVRFTVGAGGGVKWFAAPHLGVRLDGRILATFIDADATTIACGRGTCFLGLNVNVAWQAVFTAAVLVKLP